ncbi:MAG: FAD-binding oxidoreductase [Pseudomonadota bacterium]
MILADGARLNTSEVWMPNWTDAPYWHDGLAAATGLSSGLPSSVDVLVVGSGYTGLNAAIETARGGRSTLVLDAGDPGHGCSTRNGGQISTSIKPSYAKLAAKHGDQAARAIRDEGKTALDWIETRIANESIDCAFRRAGRFHAAHTPQHYEDLTRDAKTLARDDGIEAQVVPRAEQRRELGTDRYFGGLLFPHHAVLDPGRYHRGLLETAMKAGAQVMGHCAVLAIEKRPDGYAVQTTQGTLKARDVAVATNGYTGGATPWLQRRVIPIGSYIIATEPLPKALVDTLFPTGRIASDTCKVVYYYRTSPDRQRILFGGRVSAGETDTTISGPRLYADMCRIFPELSAYRISHSWMGTVAYTFDELPHTGVHDGIHFAMGYCGAGVSMASYLGMRMGQKVLGLAQGRTAFDDLTFSTRPLYTGKPWFLPPMVAWYRWRDRKQYERTKETA